ncbi:MAG: porphobilinogen synthase [Chlamydiia bacterium]|nr:porphobilinogen synthase [Chlamydiia bacterium]
MIFYRPRRNRKSQAIRDLVQENVLVSTDLIAPYFVKEGVRLQEKIEKFPNVYRFSIDLLVEEARELKTLGIPAMALFPVIAPSLKCETGKEALNPNGLIQQTISTVKGEVPDICLISDIALDPYTTAGHDGIVSDKGEILNDESVNQLVKMALTHAKAGIDIIAPSDMMDGRVKMIRQALDQSGYSHVGILSYAAKYASNFYGPFRDALGSVPSFGDKKGYQINPANRREALRELYLDEMEGADILMVKPALPYLDVIYAAKELSNLPIAAYQVSGEYSMIKGAAQNGWIDGEKVMMETLLSIKRAGADMIFTYAAKEVAETLMTL